MKKRKKKKGKGERKFFSFSVCPVFMYLYFGNSSLPVVEIR